MKRTHRFPVELMGRHTAISACGERFRLAEARTLDRAVPDCAACRATVADDDDPDPFSTEPRPDPPAPVDDGQLSMFDHYQQRG